MSNTVVTDKGGLLSPWQPGQSGNPGGRPKIPEALLTRMRDLCPEVITTMETIMRRGSKSTDRIKAAEFLWVHVYGRPPQEINLGGQADNPIAINRPLAGLTADQIAVLEGIMQNVNPTSVGEEFVLD